jgi:hypothetical protein
MNTGLSRRSLDAFAAAGRMILVSVVIGCTISLLVAVSIRFFGGAFPGPNARTTLSETSGSGYARVGRFRSSVSFSRWDTTSWAVVRPWWLTVDPDRYPDSIRFSVYACGWPLPCLYNVGGVRFPPPRSDGSSISAGAIRVGRRYALGGYIPYFVLWKGLTVNTVVYASVVLAIWHAKIACVRAIRVRRGRCRYCGYELGPIIICPECGRERIDTDAAPTTHTLTGSDQPSVSPGTIRLGGPW